MLGQSGQDVKARVPGFQTIPTLRGREIPRFISELWAFLAAVRLENSEIKLDPQVVEKQSKRFVFERKAPRSDQI